MELKDIRVRLDAINQEMVKLFVERMNLSLEVANYKREHNLPVLDRAREREILKSMAEQAGDPFEGYTRILFSTLMDLSRSYQHRILDRRSPLADEIQTALEQTPKPLPTKAVIACQGVEGAYSQMAADKLFPQGDIMYFQHFEGVFQAVERGLCQYGILPIENSSHGSVGGVYDLMRKYNFFIVRGLKLYVGHTLLAKPGASLSGITEILSHEQAIGQCSEFLKVNPQIQVRVVENTAVAAKMVAESGRTDIAAISSKNCAELYGLSVLSDSIQNSDNNYTRFICISRNLEIYPGANKISMMMTLDHKPGALYEMISKFSALGLNLTKLESRPIPGKDFEFMFYFDMEASVYSEDVLSLLSELASGPEQFTFFGSYLEL